MNNTLVPSDPLIGVDQEFNEELEKLQAIRRKRIEILRARLEEDERALNSPVNVAEPQIPARPRKPASSGRAYVPAPRTKRSPKGDKDRAEIAAFLSEHREAGVTMNEIGDSLKIPYYRVRKALFVVGEPVGDNRRNMRFALRKGA